MLDGAAQVLYRAFILSRAIACGAPRKAGVHALRVELEHLREIADCLAVGRQALLGSAAHEQSIGVIGLHAEGGIAVCDCPHIVAAVVIG